MMWFKFSLWLCLIYGIYYLVMITWDLRKGRRADNQHDTGEEITFPVESEVISVPDPPSAYDIASAVISSGGVSLKQAFSLAREEAIEYTRAVSF